MSEAEVMRVSSDKTDEYWRGYDDYNRGYNFIDCESKDYADGWHDAMDDAFSKSWWWRA